MTLLVPVQTSPFFLLRIQPHGGAITSLVVSYALRLGCWIALLGHLLRLTHSGYFSNNCQTAVNLKVCFTPIPWSYTNMPQDGTTWKFFFFLFSYMDTQDRAVDHVWSYFSYLLCPKREYAIMSELESNPVPLDHASLVVKPKVIIQISVSSTKEMLVWTELKEMKKFVKNCSPDSEQNIIRPVPILNSVLFYILLRK